MAQQNYVNFVKKANDYNYDIVTLLYLYVNINILQTTLHQKVGKYPQQLYAL